MVIVVPLSKSTKSHWIAHLKWVDFTICKIYLNKTVRKEKLPCSVCSLYCCLAFFDWCQVTQSRAHVDLVHQCIPSTWPSTCPIIRAQQMFRERVNKEYSNLSPFQGLSANLWEEIDPKWNEPLTHFKSTSHMPMIKKLAKSSSMGVPDCMLLTLYLLLCFYIIFIITASLQRSLQVHFPEFLSRIVLCQIL